ncbi:MAG: isocitrate lyase/phosphoenolpyruvate mutase family protein [Thermoleophilia bacterium]
MTAAAAPGARLRALLAEGVVAAPGSMNAMFARMVEQAGFPAVYLSGAGVAHNLLGVPDVGLTTLTEMAQAATNMCHAVSIPVVADADTGFGGAANVERTVRLYEQAGVAAIQLEDQVMPKRCGHFEGKEVVETREMLARLRAAVHARRDPSFMIVARTDARSVLGLDEAIRRGLAFAGAGADAIFVEAPASDEELDRIGRELGATGLPLVANMVEGGKTPLHSAEELAAMGFRLVIFPGFLMRLTSRAAQEGLAELARGLDSRPLLDRMLMFDGVQRIVGTDELVARVKSYEEPS